jgi:serine/threonine protein kinase/Tol biopolymer transport system component
MPLAPGTRLGRYEIRSKIGEGGMGEVYVARDSQLGRDVAVKVLPSTYSYDAERLRRFEQEACAASALNHPNILAIYDVGTHNGWSYVVSELLEGQTLRQRISGTALPQRKAIDYALQVADGLAAAHKKGIVHRDLKPDNLFITNDGNVKILDFGLAKLTGVGDTELSQTSIPTRRVDTDPGKVMGTAGYMSPEQVKGRAVDHRADIFSFGAILYEMLSGRRAFHGESAAETMSAILKEDPPDLSETNQSVSPALQRLVNHCLEKNPEERFHSANDLAFALDALTSFQTSGEVSAAGRYTDESTRTRRKLRDWLGWSLAAMMLITISTLASLYFRRIEPRRETIRFTLNAPDKMTFGDSLALSPDGTRLAFAAIAGTGEPTLWVRPLDSVDAQKLQGTEGGAFPFWSTDGRYLGFFAGGKLKKIEVNGGSPQTLTDTALEARGGSWGPDGTIIFSPGLASPLFKISAAGGTPTQITQLDQSLEQSSHRWPWFLPDGRHFLYLGSGNKQDQEGVFVGSLDSSERKFLLNSRVGAIYAGSSRDSSQGYLLLVRAGTLVAQQFDTRGLELSGESVTIAENVLSFPTTLGPTGSSVMSASANGRLVFRVGGQPVSQLTWFDRSGKRLEALFDPGTYHEPMISPDAKKIVMSRKLDNNQEIWVLDISPVVKMTRFTFDPAIDISAIWTPDGSHIIFASNRSGKFELYQKASTGAGVDELLLDIPGQALPQALTPDGKYLLFISGSSKTKSDIWVLPMFGDHKPFPILQSDSVEWHAQFSPDGHWIAYGSDESGHGEVYVRSFPLSGGQWQISTSGGDQPIWNPREKEICYMAPDRSIVSVAYNVVGGSFQTAAPKVLFATHAPQSSMVLDRNSYLISPDGRFLVNELVDEGLSTPLTLVLNWDGDFKK